MTVDASNIEQYNGKSVELTIGDKKMEGTVEMASPMGIAFRPKGKRDVQLIEIPQLSNIELLPEKPKPLVARTLQPIGEGSARRHLFHLHNFTRDELKDVTDEEALEIHDDIDHSDLGHKHKDPNAEENDENEDDDQDESDDED